MLMQPVISSVTQFTPAYLKNAAATSQCPDVNSSHQNSWLSYFWRLLRNCRTLYLSESRRRACGMTFALIAIKINCEIS
jgi:hypothetical protein